MNTSCPESSTVKMMNAIANGNGKGAAVRSSSAVGHFPQNQQALQGIQKVAAMVVPVAARLAPIAARKAIAKNSAVPLDLKVPVAALLREGEIAAARMEQKCFGPNAAETEVGPSEVAMEAALTEVLAAEANHARQESEAAALIGTALSIAIASLQGKRALRPIVPALVQTTARLVRLMRERGPAGRQLLRLVPTILRRTVASLLAARQAGRAIDPAFASRVMAAQAARVLANSQVMTQAMIRNAVIRQRTVAPVRSTANSQVVSSNSRRFSPMTMLNEGLFEAPVSHEANPYSNPYANPEFEDEWETNPELANEWEMQAGSHYSNPYSNPESHYGNPYSNPELEEEWETYESHYSNPYSNPELANEWETNPESLYSNPYSNPEFEEEWETNPESLYSNPYSNPELEDEGEYFFGGLKKLAKSAWKVAAPLAKKLAPKLAGTLVGMIPGVGAVAGPLAAKLAGALIKEGEMEAAQLEASAFGTNAAEAEVANTEVAHEAALTEVLAAQAAEANTEAEAEMAIGTALPITITIMGGRRALRPVMPVLAQANARLTGTLRRQGPTGRQLLRTVPAIQRRTVGILKAAARSGQPVVGATAVKAMAAATRQVLGNPKTVQRAIVRNAVLRQRTAPPNPRRMAARPCPTCAR
jgi:hypothetical protein